MLEFFLRLVQFLEGITAWVDPAGLHLRFGRGGFNLAKASRGAVAPGDTRTVVALAPRATVADAAE